VDGLICGLAWCELNDTSQQEKAMASGTDYSSEYLVARPSAAA
jgi:hypothetical protein